jgi:anti-anti-sigma regulatory factor
MGNGMDPVHIKHAAGKAHVTLAPSLGVADVRALYETLGSLLTGKSPISLDGGPVEHLDTAAMQVLTNFYHTAGARGLVVTWKKISPGLQRAARLLGLEFNLGMTS